jgi:putative ABC transport system substrate-binding protein
MFRLALALLLLILLALGAFASAQGDDSPTVAVLRFGGSYDFSVTESTLLDVLEARDFISAEERATMDGRADLHGASVNILWGDAGWDLPTVNLMVEGALDAGADVIVALTTPVAQAAINATLDMEQPPVILFASVYHPFAAGIAAAPCLKPAHITGIQTLPKYDDLLLLLSIQAPEISTIGVVFNSSETSGAIGARTITELAEAQGLTVLQTAVTTLADVPVSIEGLVSRGMEALLLPVDSITAKGLHSIAHLSYEYDFPILYASVGSIFDGATMGVGHVSHFQQGVNLGRMLTGYLKGDMDVSLTAIDELSGRMLGVNLDAAEEQGVTVAEHLRENADVLFAAGEQSMSAAARALSGKPSIERLREAETGDAAYLASLQCTDEMIAEQQAALDAAGE